jgi:hypothetical protein
MTLTAWAEGLPITARPAEVMIRPPHPFARFIQILGRGKTLSRSLTIEEAEEAMAMILAGDVLPEQLGAFLMLLRMKEESPEEIAGFVRAARAAMTLPAPLPKADLDYCARRFIRSRACSIPSPRR